MSLAIKNIEPIPGYTLRERLGSGGYGEVWKADVPGGLFKAVKLVYGLLDGDRASHELKALNRIKSLRHPFLLSLERIEVVDGQLLIVTELADCSLKDLFDKRRADGLNGIPRSELMQYMRDTADALDYINEHHSLQHLDIKPENLLLVGRHVKVADFGLVKDVHEGAVSVMGGLTPLYAAPELFNGTPSRRSDQYSLAIVFQYMLTGTMPFPGKTTTQLANQHIHAKPALFTLPPGDRKVIARALAKDPQQRFASCIEMVEFLQNESLQNSLPDVDTMFPEPASSHPSASTDNLESTIRLGTKSGANGLGHNSENAATEHLNPAGGSSGNNAHVSPAMRRASDMFEDLDEAEHHCQSDLIDTRLLRIRESIKQDNIDAPALTGNATLRPTVIVGVGRIAGIVLQKMKLEMVDRLGVKSCPTVEYLLLDTDGSDVMRAGRGEDGAPLEPHELLHTPLRKSQDYRSDGQALLSWISRRWLFNIPRSQKTEGLRPLGRLALVDHARSVHARLKKALQRVSAAESIAAANERSPVPIAGAPRVIVVGASCGGTAGGMLLDVGLIARQMLGRLGFEDREVCGVLLHYLGRNASAHELAMVNTFSTLSELAHYSRTDVEYPGDPSCGLEPLQRDHAPFKQTYLHRLPDHLTDETLVKAVEPIANYLFLDAFTPAAEYYQACRTASESEPTLLRSFGLYRVGAMSSDLIPVNTMRVCVELFERWIGERQPLLAEVETKVEQDINAQLQARNMDYDKLTQRILCELSGDLPQLAQAHFRALILAGGKPLAVNQLLQLDFREVIKRVNETLGKRDAHSLGDASSWPKLLNELGAGVAGLADAETAFFTKYLQALADQSGLRIAAGLHAHKILMKHLAALNDAARQHRQALDEQGARLEHLLGIEHNAALAKTNPLRKSFAEYEKHFLLYIQMRLQMIASHFIQTLFRRLSSALSKLGDQMLDIRRELKGSISKMAPGAFQNAEENAVSAALREMLSQLLKSQSVELVAKLDRWMQERLAQTEDGFLATMTKGGEQRLQWMKELVEASRTCVMHAMLNIDMAQFILAEKNRLAESLKQARPQALGQAECRTMITFSADNTSTEQIASIAKEAQLQLKAVPALVGQKSSEFNIVCELSGIKIEEAAQRLIDFRPDIADCAQRIFSRNDIPFEPLNWEPRGK